MPTNAVRQLTASDTTELRRKNRATVEQYMRTKGQDRLRRHELFTEDGSCGLWTTDTGAPIVISELAKPGLLVEIKCVAVQRSSPASD